MNVGTNKVTRRELQKRDSERECKRMDIKYNVSNFTQMN